MMYSDGTSGSFSTQVTARRQRFSATPGNRTLVAGVIACVAFLGGGLAAERAAAQDLVYTPVNPSFGGNAFNSSHLLGIANLQNDYDDPDARRSRSQREETSPAELFARQLQSRLLAEVSNDVVEAIFGEDPQNQGEVVFGDTVIRFNRGLSEVDLTIEDQATGSVTEISVPLLQ